MKTTKKINPQLLLAGCGIILFSLLFIFGKTVAKKDKPAQDQPVSGANLSFSQVMLDLKGRLTPSQNDYITKLENSVTRGAVKEQQIHVNHQLAAFWRDSLNAFLPYAWYTGEAAKLENSEKSLTFAAHLMESRLRAWDDNPALQNLLASNAKVLFEKALAINPANDSSVIGLGACIIFGGVADNPMEGIQKVRVIAEKDPGNVYAQKVLAFGGLKTGQLDKAIERFRIVLEKEPGNIEVLYRLTEAYERKGDKKSAITYYRQLLALAKSEEERDAIEHRITELNK
ncbi:MAG: hypothetical protein K0Q66_469 [Chitinophagaceae bacterium]|nr:hypothetical protein [Chitinophagaceae bacterium]